MDIETRKLKHYLTLFNNAYFDKDHLWILCETVGKSKLHWINKPILGHGLLLWI
jgi:hypothetical protein